MSQNIPDQAEKLRQIAAQESTPDTQENKGTAVLDTPSGHSLEIPHKDSNESIKTEPSTLSEEGKQLPSNISAASHPPANGSKDSTSSPQPESSTGMQKEDAASQPESPVIQPATALSSEKKLPGVASTKPLEDRSTKTENHKSKETQSSTGTSSESQSAPVPSKQETVTPSVSLPKRRLPLASSTQVIAVTGGKGGVGKSNIACNLAIVMSQMKKKVLVLDADLSLANVDVLMGLSPRHNLSHVLKGEKKVSEILLEGPSGIQIIPGGSGIEELSQLDSVQMNRLFDAFDGIQPVPDMLIVDTAAGIHPNVMQFLTAADQVIVVTTPEPTAYTDAYALIKNVLNHDRHKEIGLLVNMAQTPKEAAEIVRLMLQMCKQFLQMSFNNLGYVSLDPEVRKAVQCQKPFILRTPSSPASCSIRNIAAAVLQIEVKQKQPGGLRRFLRRMFRSSSTRKAS